MIEKKEAKKFEQIIQTTSNIKLQAIPQMGKKIFWIIMWHDRKKKMNYKSDKEKWRKKSERERERIHRTTEALIEATN